MGGSSSAAPPDWSDTDEVYSWVSSLIDDRLEGVDTALDLHRAGVLQQQQPAGALNIKGARRTSASSLMAALPCQGNLCTN